MSWNVSAKGKWKRTVLCNGDINDSNRDVMTTMLLSDVKNGLFSDREEEFISCWCCQKLGYEHEKRAGRELATTKLGARCKNNESQLTVT